MDYRYKKLVEDAKSGSTRATQDLIGKLEPLIYSAIGRCKNGRDREDLYQEACILIMEAIKDFDEDRGVPFLAFVKNRIYYGIHNLTRKNHYEISLDQPLWEEDGQTMLDLLEDKGEGMEEGIIREEILDSLRKGMESLTQKQKEVIIGHYFEGKKFKDIAIDRQVHYKTVLRLKDRAIKKLREELGNL